MAKRKNITPIPPYDPLEEFQEEYRGRNREENHGVKPQQKVKQKKKLGCLSVMAICLTMIVLVSALLFFTVIFQQALDYRAHRKEYASLWKLSESIEGNIVDADLTDTPETFVISEFDKEMRRINPDYLCWIKIDGTVVDYPVVRGNDNEKYLGLSFYGEENMYGSLFMDYRCVGQYVPHIIIYGHNTKLGDMFGSLKNFLDKDYLAEHPVITLKVNERIAEYKIFSARKTDVSDPAYALGFDNPSSFRAFAESCAAPENTTQIITLSTCAGADNNDERIIIQGALQ